MYPRATTRGNICSRKCAHPAIFGSTAEIVALMLCFNLGVLSATVGLSLYQLAVRTELPTVRLAATRAVPEMPLRPGERWHLFLSHIWSSGQDQMAVTKRQLQLLLPGVQVFLGTPAATRTLVSPPAFD